ncbi:MAG: type II secretion system GspH family protein [Verrucomicrobiota bacterium]|nr:type II secretion system GspH family protein [Verrucomicrobiota bacterium]
MELISKSRDAFTLIELLVVITIIVVLMGLLFPAFKGVQDQAKRTQAKNDVTQIVTAINAFYTEYGRYTCDTQTGADGADFFAADDDTNSKTFDILRGDPANGFVQTYNPKAIAFMQPTIAKDLNKPRSGIGGNGRFYDPWGSCYRLRIDNNYSGAVENPYSSNAGFNPIQQGIIAWSIGRDLDGAKTATGGGDKKAGTSDDDVISWQ